MRGFMRLLVPVAAMAAYLVAVPANATDIQFASYNSVAPLAFSASNAGGLVTLSETGKVNFTFLTTNQASSVNGASANIAFIATAPSTAFSTSGKHTYQDELAGSFVFTSTTAITTGSRTYAAGSNLLTAVFTNAELSVNYNSLTGGLADDTLSGTVTYSSDFLNFGNTVADDFSISLSGLNPPFTSPQSQLPPFLASPVGIFSNDPGPTSTSGVPEPATWAMMLVGFGAIGLGLRGKSRQSLPAA